MPHPALQLAWTPATLALFLLVMGAAEHGTLAGGGAKLAACFGDILRANYALWPAVQYVNLGFVPPRYQVLAANVVGVAWAVYLSAAVNSSPPGPDDGPGDAAARAAAAAGRRERREMAAEAGLTKAYATRLQPFASYARAPTLSPSFGEPVAVHMHMGGGRVFAPKVSPAAGLDGPGAAATAAASASRPRARLARFFAGGGEQEQQQQQPAAPPAAPYLPYRGYTGRAGVAV